MKYCIHCGTELHEGMKFCLNCGEKIPVVSGIVSSNSRNDETNERVITNSFISTEELVSGNQVYDQNENKSLSGDNEKVVMNNDCESKFALNDGDLKGSNGYQEGTSVITFDNEKNSKIDDNKLPNSEENKPSGSNENGFKKKKYLIIAVVAVVLLGCLMFAISGDDTDSEKTAESEQETTQSYDDNDNTYEDDNYDDESYEEDGYDGEDESSSDNSVFSPQDVSDSTIESIETYNDYLDMYKKICDDYISNYEKVIKGTTLYDEASFKSTKEEMDKSFEQQKEQYSSMGDKKIVGKDTLVKFLKEYRDNLKEYTDNLKKNLGV